MTFNYFYQKMFLKTYNQTNFFKHTFCEFQQVDDFQFLENTYYKSKSNSIYFYTEKGVYRKSNHWGRVANCRWRLIASKNYKNQQFVIGFAKWADFYPINSSEKIFFIKVDFEAKKTTIQPTKEETNHYLFTYTEAQKRIKQINHLLKDDKWTNYFELKTEELRFNIVTEFINSDISLQEIKSKFN